MRLAQRATPQEPSRTVSAPRAILLVAGEPSGDLLAAEFVRALRWALAVREPDRPLPVFLGAGGPALRGAGAELAFDLTQHAVIGLSDVLRKYLQFRRLFRELLELAAARRPDAVVCVDFGGFNRRFAAAVRRRAARTDWRPKVVQFVSPQVWASRPGRARTLARDLDLLLTILPFEQAWYAERFPALPVQFVGHPILDRHSEAAAIRHRAALPAPAAPRVLLLPGSRRGEIARHWPAVAGAVRHLSAALPEARFRAVLPREDLAQQARALDAPAGVEFTTGADALRAGLAEAAVALASTGTVTLECAVYGVPTVTFYRTSALTYAIGRRIVTVKSLTMPNLLAGGAVFPEFVQHEVTGENLAGAALALLQDAPRRAGVRRQLDAVVGQLGEPGAAGRAAAAVAN
ncbi:MAG TPA: lipid-A-disaccharide synthase, partial [Verrucomicrobiota bacterium]|nr:lipid-A-disaccharide synthase [Verrucomicrobiota bacterium]